MHEYKVGDRVYWHTGSYCSEQGQRDKSWWPIDKIGIIVEFRNHKVLLEFEDKTRNWAGEFEIGKKSRFPNSPILLTIHDD